MKCFVCGKELESGKYILNTYLCRNFCSHECEQKYTEKRIGKAEPTTAQMLLWLFYNTNFRIRNDGELGYYQNECFTKFEYEFQNKSKDEAVKRAYERAKEEQND